MFTSPLTEDSNLHQTSQAVGEEASRRGRRTQRHGNARLHTG
jgi:hypothetical protein